jgi:hypothetical protein
MMFNPHGLRLVSWTFKESVNKRLHRVRRPAWEFAQRLEIQNLCVQGAESRPFGTMENQLLANCARLNAVIAVTNAVIAAKIFGTQRRAANHAGRRLSGLRRLIPYEERSYKGDEEVSGAAGTTIDVRTNDVIDARDAKTQLILSPY